MEVGEAGAPGGPVLRAVEEELSTGLNAVTLLCHLTEEPTVRGILSSTRTVTLTHAQLTVLMLGTFMVGNVISFLRF